ncbi:MAG: hypothetical protein Ct9H90mP9_2340 [Pseudomonadota bacterium]|nr:MAG: hypothetical protein Ct9H90mP9_2340 [Pseudomonadota bacterium]
MNEDQEEYYRVPQDRELIAQELLLFENGGTDDLENLVDTPFSQSGSPSSQPGSMPTSSLDCSNN